MTDPGLYLDNVGVSEEEDNLVALDAGLQEDLLQVVAELHGAVAPLQGQLEQLTARDEAGQVRHRRLPTTVQTNLAIQDIFIYFFKYIIKCFNLKKKFFILLTEVEKANIKGNLLTF